MNSQDNNQTIDNEQLIQYALGKLTADEMAKLDEVAVTNPELNQKRDSLLQLVETIKTVPELEQTSSNPDQMTEFLKFLLKEEIWSWSETSGAKEAQLEAIQQKFQEWTMQRQPESQTNKTNDKKRFRWGRTLVGCGLIIALIMIPAYYCCHIDTVYLTPEKKGIVQENRCEYLCVDMAEDFEYEQGLIAPSVMSNEVMYDKISPSPNDEEVQKPLLPNDMDGFTAVKKNTFLTVADNPFSTFGLDVDTASFTIAKEYINEYGHLPLPESVREEEYINYFDWELPMPEAGSTCPFRPTVEIGRHPLKPNLLLAKIGIQGKIEDRNNVKPLNLTYLIDISGSMSDENKLELIKQSLRKQVNFLRDDDTISIVTYSNSADVVLSATPVKHRKEIKAAIESLHTYGGTNASDGLLMAYQENKKQFNPEGINRVILCSDGDFNVGVTDKNELESIIKQQAKSGIFLTVLGFGMGNYKDNTMELLANHGQGSYHYINNKKEAKRILEDENFGSMVTIAKDVKIQIDFNPAKVQSYRLIGYENRVMEAQDFNNDKKESGNIGMGQNVLALYEIVPVGEKNPLEPSVDKSRYEKFQKTASENTANAKVAEDAKNKTEIVQFDPLANELFLLKIRWKEPSANKSQYQDFPIVMPTDEQMKNVTSDFQFAYAVALFAQILSDGNYTDGATFDDVLKMIPDSDNEQYKKFTKLVEKAKKIR